MTRFLVNFIIMFGVVFVLGSSIDLVLQLDNFTEAARTLSGDDGTFTSVAAAFLKVAVNYHGPRIFQVYAYLLGLVCVGAMAFTLAQMYRHRELVALMASGVSLYRIGWPIFIVAFFLNTLQLLNSNLVLPELAPMLLRDHDDLGRDTVTAFEVPFTIDSNGALFHAALFDPETQTLTDVSIRERAPSGRTIRRIGAESALWNDERQAWRLVNGQALRLIPAQERLDDVAFTVTPVEYFPTDLSPRALTMNRYREYAQMLSIQQIEEMLDAQVAVDAAALARVKYGRFSVFMSNLFLLVLTMPFFLIREPANLLRRSVGCAAVAIPANLLILVLMEVSVADFPPAVSVFLPAAVLFLLAIAAVTMIRT